MSTYVMSDVHGYYDKYIEFLRSVNFDINDTLYIIGDSINRGKDGIKLLQDIMKRKNVHLIKGNHELMIYQALNELYNCEKTFQPAKIIDEVCLFPISQRDTLNDFCQLKKVEQKEIIDLIYNLPLYKEIIVNSQKYLLVHAGLPEFSDMDINLYDEEELLFGQHDYSINHYKNTIIIVGHTPTRNINHSKEDIIYRKNDSICIDCGLGFGGRLGVLCIDTDEEFYY